MYKQEEEKLKSEFVNKEIIILDWISNNHCPIFTADKEEIADWWLKKIAEREAESREKMVEEIEKLENYYRIEGIYDDLLKKEEVISIIKNKEE